MRKQILRVVFCSLLLIPLTDIHAQSTVQNGQSTEGKDFWVTFLQADQNKSDNGDWDGNYNTLTLSLSISSRKDCSVKIENPYSQWDTTVNVTANQRELVEVYNGSPLTTAARAAMTNSKRVCYAVNNETVDTCALHITSTEDIALFATNYKKATFDATNVLPTSSLLNEYYIQTYTPSDHGNTAQGSHFAVVAVEDNTKVWYTPSVLTPKYSEYRTYLNNRTDPFADPEQVKADSIKWSNFKIGEHTDSVVLQAGQVYYVWTEEGEGEDYDLSGTFVKADKKIAVFQGNPHTNVPAKVKDRDHVYSQAMPTQYWGNTFVLTGSESRLRDFVRIMALNDETEVRVKIKQGNTIVDSLIHKFDFSKDKKHYWEFEIGDKTVKGGDTDKEANLTTRPLPTIEGNNCIITTSCPAAVHLFTASRMWDGNKKHFGDPSMLWVNPIEQQIDQVTFATYKSKNASSSNPTRHYVNIVTEKPESMMLNNKSIKDSFQVVSCSDSSYFYAQIYLGEEASSHTLKSTDGKFIAHVYGFTGNESYGYSAGGATKPLTQYITINGEIFTPDSKNTLCGDDTIKFACHPDYDYEKIEWYFGDGTSNLENKDSVPHEYKEAGVYNAYVLIYRNSSNVCVGQNAIDSIPITVTIGNYKVELEKFDIPDCTTAGTEVDLTIHLNNESKVDLSGEGVSINFTQEAIDDGLTNDKLSFVNDSTLVVHLPKTAKEGKDYGLHLHIDSDCPNSVLDKDLTFSLTFSKKLMEQRYNNVLGLIKDSFPNQTLSDFVWYHDGEVVPDQTTSVLYLDETNPATEGEYKVCYTIHEAGKPDKDDCTCPTFFHAPEMTRNFGTPDQLVITATYAWKGEKVFVNADWNGETDIECYAQWINVSGDVVNGEKFNIPDGGCTIPVPSENGFYILRVVTDGTKRSFKFIINH